MRKNSNIRKFHHNIFYEIPIRLIYEEKYRDLSDSAKISYSVLKNREFEHEENCIRIYLADLSISSNDLEEWL